LEIDYDAESGWGKPKISQYQKFEIDPRNSTLHYSIEIYEGLKAYRKVTDEKKLLLFRPNLNMSRMNISASKVGLPVSHNIVNFVRIFQVKS
jgi:branched-chain amino acid aminotransferase